MGRNRHSVLTSSGMNTKTMYAKKSMGVERKTFIIDEHRIIQKIYSKVKVAGHVAQVLSDLKSL